MTGFGSEATGPSEEDVVGSENRDDKRACVEVRVRERICSFRWALERLSD